MPSAQVGEISLNKFRPHHVWSFDFQYPMKHLATFSSLLGALCLAAPVTGWSDDHHHHHDGGGHSYGSYRPYCGPSAGFGYRHYPSYGYYSPYSYYPGYSYYGGPSVNLNFSTRPTYGGYYRGESRASDDGDDLAVDVQRALSRRGFYHGAIDGEVGPGTRGAIREYQYRNHLEVTGRIDRSLLQSLGMS